MTTDEIIFRCYECDGEEIPELCPKCFPRYDDARIANIKLLGV